MFDDLEAYFHENVWDSYNKYVKTRKALKAGKSNDLKIALIAASALFHLREHIPTNKSQSYASIVHRCQDYELLGDVVNASKHKGITHRKNALINSATDLSEAIVSTNYKDKQGEYRHIEKAIFIKLKNGTERDLFEVLTNVMNMWLNLLHSFGFINFIKPVEIKKRKIPRRTKNSGRIDFVSIQRLRWKSTIRMQRYNYDTGKIEPEDLTGSKFSMNIYKPAYSVCLKGKNEKTGQEINLEVSMIEKQKKHLEKLATDNERLAYFIKIAIEQGILKENSLGKTDNLQNA